MEDNKMNEAMSPEKLNDEALEDVAGGRRRSQTSDSIKYYFQNEVDIPCPFCGVKDGLFVYGSDGPDLYYVSCYGCHLCTSYNLQTGEFRWMDGFAPMEKRFKKS